MSHSSAATTTGPATPFQAAFNRLHTAPLEQGIVPFSPKAAFSQVKICTSPLSAYFNSFVVQADLEKLKSDASLTLNEAFFGQLADAAEGGEGRAVAFLQVEQGMIFSPFTDILLCRVSCGAHSAWLLCTHSKGSPFEACQGFGARFALI